jgi:23S rRNA (cytosine1962-C5)-methyltransferase
MKKIKSLRLKAKEERRFKQGHPWVFSNELQESPKSLELGEVVSLHDAGGEFLAYGFGNPHSLISFRELTREKKIEWFLGEEVSPDYFHSRIWAAQAFRKSWFGKDQSYRLVYGEADGLSGLIIDRFFGPGRVVYVVQPHASGMDRNLASVMTALKKFSEEMGDPSERSVVLRRDASSREREGLEKAPTMLVDLNSGKELSNYEDFRAFLFQVSGIMATTLELKTDLITGQKTGFFFDQLQNIRLLETILLRKLRYDRGASPTKKADGYRVLDLCSYVGQWSLHLMQTLVEREQLPADFTCVDASEAALKIAKDNLESFANKNKVSGDIKVHTVKADVLEPMTMLKNQGFDLVIADPPAFIKSRKSISQGKQAYANLYQTAIEKVKPGGLVVCCSCSQLLSHEDFVEVLGKASRRSKRRVRWLLEGSPSFDHFTRLDFQEGHYLKCFIGQVDEA